MNRSLPILLCCLLCFSFFIRVSSVNADIIPKEMKPIYVQANLTNLDDYPDHVFVQLETLGQEVRKKELINEKGQVRKGYKLNQLVILAVPGTLLDAAGGLDHLDGLDLLADPDVISSSLEPVESGQQLTPRPSDISGKDIFYTVSMDKNRLTFKKTGEKIYKEAPNAPDVNLLPYAFGVTFFVEWIIFMILIRWILPGPVPGTGRAFVCVLGAQVATLPLLWLFITHYHLYGTRIILGAELFAVLAETLVYRFAAKTRWQTAFIAALICNAASYGIGMLV